MHVSYKLLVSLCFTLLYFSCNKDFYLIGEELFVDQTISTFKENYPAYTFQEYLQRVETSVQNMVQLGKIEHPIFGRSEASIVSQLSINNSLFFGDLRQDIEESENPSSISVIPENEKVTAVYLDLPFFTNQKDKDNDGVIDSLDVDPEDPESNSDEDELTDFIETQAGLNPLSADSDGDGILDHNDTDNESYESENNVYEIDSIYGNSNASFNLKVFELTYYLNSLDPAKNFETDRTYYSDDDFFERGFYDAILHDKRINLNFEELRFNYEEDDPETADIDESIRVETRLTPRIRVPLDVSFFQERLIDQEGKPSLETNKAFQEVMRGIIIQTDNFSEDLYMLLSLSDASIRVEYEYDKYNVNGTAEDESDDFIEKARKELSMSLSGVRINVIKNEVSSPEINELLESSTLESPSKKLYIKGGKFHGRIRLFSEENEDEQNLLDDLKRQNWLINQAKLVFYIDPDQNLTDSKLFADRLYLYKYDSGEPLLDYINDNSEAPNLINGNKITFGGFLEYDNNNKPYRYAFDITKHISDIIRNDSPNIDLGLVVTSNINDNSLLMAFEDLSEDSNYKYPRAATLNPLGTILLGSSPSENLSEKKVQLELTYSSY